MQVWQVYGSGFCLLEISGVKIYGFLENVNLYFILKKFTQMFPKNSLFHFFKYFFPFCVISPLVPEKN